MTMNIKELKIKYLKMGFELAAKFVTIEEAESVPPWGPYINFDDSEFELEKLIKEIESDEGDLDVETTD
jgi:hypothetical protein